MLPPAPSGGPNRPPDPRPACVGRRCQQARSIEQQVMPSTRFQWQLGFQWNGPASSAHLAGLSSKPERAADLRDAELAKLAAGTVCAGQARRTDESWQLARVNRLPS